jgi:transcriptional regulator with XRE-family HTH domain
MESVNEKIKRLRIKSGVNQADVARSAGIKQSSYASIEKGDTKSITINVGKGIAKALGVSFNELFDVEISPDKDEKKLLNEIERLKRELSDLEGLCEIQRESLSLYKQSFTVTDRMVELVADKLSKLIPEGDEAKVIVDKIRSQALSELQKEFPDLYFPKKK